MLSQDGVTYILSTKQIISGTKTRVHRISLLSYSHREMRCSSKEVNQQKINLQDSKPNLKPPCLFQSSQVRITKVQCCNCNSSRDNRRRVREMTDQLRNFEQVMQKGVGEGLRYISTLCGKK